MDAKGLRQAPKLLAVFAVAVLGLGLWRGDSGLKRYFELKRSRTVLQKTVDDLTRENERISDEINRLKTSPEYARKVLRDKYHETDANESIMFFAD